MRNAAIINQRRMRAWFIAPRFTRSFTGLKITTAIIFSKVKNNGSEIIRATVLIFVYADIITFLQTVRLTAPQTYFFCTGELLIEAAHLRTHDDGLDLAGQHTQRCGRINIIKIPAHPHRVVLTGIASDNGVIISTYLNQVFGSKKPSTVDEIREADILLHIVDVSHSFFEDQYQIVNKTLAEILQDLMSIQYEYEQKQSGMQGEIA